jgi:N-acetylmuramoyl-L-alanine amidase
MEKDIVLDVGLRLQKLVRDKLGAKVIMTRNEDVFIPLEERTAIANTKGADLFVSIHANSSRKPGIRGVETYLLGRASDKDAMDTAMRENSASDKSADDLQLILTDLLTTAKKDESFRLAHYVQSNIIDRLEPGYKAVNLGVKQAPFFVLVHASMPSILAEISFISNPAEERLLSEGAYRQEIAEAIFEGIRRYVQSTPMLSQPDEARNITIR